MTEVEAPPALEKVEGGQYWVMQIRAIVTGLVLMLGACVAELVLSNNDAGLPKGIVLAPVLLLLIYPVVIGPRRHYRALGYARNGNELRVARGVLTRTETFVPLCWVQHIDVAQGPLERAFGVTRLVLHTAGTMNSLVTIPGLSRERAETIRDEIRARIGSGLQ